MNPKVNVSVIIATHNRSKLLAERSVQSIQNQTFKDWELIVVDDGSTDNTEEVMSILCSRDSRIRYFKQENSGAGIARNRGIDEARGQYIALCDDDDEFLPEYLNTILPYFGWSPKTVCLSCASYIKDDYGIETIVKPPLEPFWSSPVGNGWIFRADILKQFKFDSIKAEDLDLRIRLEQAGHRYHVGRIDQPLRRYYLGLKKDTKSYSTDTEHHAIAFEQFFEKYESFYRITGNKALSWLYYWGGLSNMRAGNLHRGRAFLGFAWKYGRSVRYGISYVLSFFGGKVFNLIDRWKTRGMRYIRYIRCIRYIRT